MQTRTQYSVMVPNEPGQLAKVTAVLMTASVNLSGVTSLNLGRSACLKFIAEPEHGLPEKLAAAGFQTTESQVFELELGESAEALHVLTRDLAERGINILSCYGNSADGAMKLIVAVDRPETAAALLDSVSSLSQEAAAAR